MCTSSLHHVIDQVFPIFMCTLKATEGLGTRLTNDCPSSQVRLPSSILLARNVGMLVGDPMGKGSLHPHVWLYTGMLGMLHPQALCRGCGYIMLGLVCYRCPQRLHGTCNVSREFLEGHLNLGDLHMEAISVHGMLCSIISASHLERMGILM